MRLRIMLPLVALAALAIGTIENAAAVSGTPTVVKASSPTNKKPKKFATANCPNNKSEVLGGGAAINNGGRRAVLQKTKPTGSSWEARAVAVGGYKKSWTVKVFVICAAP